MIKRFKIKMENNFASTISAHPRFKRLRAVIDLHSKKKWIIFSHTVQNRLINN